MEIIIKGKKMFVIEENLITECNKKSNLDKIDGYIIKKIVAFKMSNLEFTGRKNNEK